MSTNTKSWNPRFESYAKANGRTPEAMLKFDEERYPGGKMAGFLCWIGERRSEFVKAYPEAMLGDMIRDQDAWTAFLASYAARAGAEIVGRTIVKMAKEIAELFKTIAANDLDPNDYRSQIRDAIVKNTGLDDVRASNIVRLAIHRFNTDHGGSGYTENDLRQIIDRVARG